VVDLTGTDEPRARLAAIVDSSDDAIISKDFDGTIASWNRGAERLYGYTAEEAIGRPVTILFPAAISHEEEAILRRVGSGRRIEHYETVRIRKDGSPVDVSLSISPVRDDTGRIIGISKIARDITERKRADRALRSSERRIRQLMELLPVAVYTCSAPAGVLTFYNEQATRLWGRRPRPGETHASFASGFRLFRPDGTPLPPERVPMAVALREGRPFRGEEVLMERPDGSRVVVMVHIDLLRDENDRVIGAINAFHDVTVLRQATEELRQADRRKSEFLAILAHELRNPLAPIFNAVELLSWPEADPQKAQAAIDIMRRQLAQMGRLIDDLLDISRISRGRIELRCERVDVASIVQQAVEATRPIVDRHEHDLSVSLPAHAVWLNADPARLAQALGNLLNNASKFTPRGGRLGIEVEPRGGRVAIRVRDNGIGIAQDQLEGIFGMFAQLNPAVEDSQAGLGIGLTLARNLVELHGGTLEARSSGVGRGSEFVLDLPVLASVVAPQPARDTGHAARAPRGRKHVLVVDDNRDSAESLAMLLKLKGYKVQTAHDGMEAIEAAAACQPDAVLLDIGLPLLNGYEVARHLRGQRGHNVQLIAITGWGQHEDRQRSRGAGFDGHLVKPVDLGELIRALEEWDGAAAPSSSTFRR
jgi:two-component system CheB/CheR fusion protein